MEISTVDTALLLAGALFCQSYFDRPAAAEETMIVLLIIPFKLSTIASLTYLQILKRSRAYSLIQFAKILVERVLGWMG